MKNWFARWFGGATRADAGTPAVPHVPAAAAQAAPAAHAQPSFDLELAFHAWLSGPVAHAGETRDALILDELAKLARQPDSAAELVPRVPAVVPQLLRSLREEGTSSTELARQVAQDVTLVAEVIREVNSPYYRPAAPVRTIEGAVMLLGQNGLRMLLARVAFRPVISAQTGRLARQAAPQLWRQSEKCALATSLAAPGCGADPFEACLAGLMQNVGLVVALRLIDQVDGAGRMPQSDAFAHAMRGSARVLSARIAQEWELPPPVGAAILQAGEADTTPLARALRVGDRLATLRVLAEAGVEEAQEAVGQLPDHERRIFDKLGES
ncbi:HDOD domain-containing protein [Massilia sp. G4R7]|uniref:HDOD domain-containing protein n=1 Tax=Massilia phyllostachyos TaxID=2898585 RepID=A0ABS8Q462_9BURK|nr:HDOD domain-containing protein [Massilia phyllostachyos]MCD2516527.1 HDOD domain-containing protein [Massilia phyllostachyos]